MGQAQNRGWRRCRMRFIAELRCVAGADRRVDGRAAAESDPRRRRTTRCWSGSAKSRPLSGTPRSRAAFRRQRRPRRAPASAGAAPSRSIARSRARAGALCSAAESDAEYWRRASIASASRRAGTCCWIVVHPVRRHLGPSPRASIVNSSLIDTAAADSANAAAACSAAGVAGTPAISRNVGARSVLPITSWIVELAHTPGPRTKKGTWTVKLHVQTCTSSSWIRKPLPWTKTYVVSSPVVDDAALRRRRIPPATEVARPYSQRRLCSAAC